VISDGCTRITIYISYSRKIAGNKYFFQRALISRWYGTRSNEQPGDFEKSRGIHLYQKFPGTEVQPLKEY
jgi:hypothetical protein